MLSCVATAAGSRLGGVAACKLTGLTDPSLLERLSTALASRGVSRGDGTVPLAALDGALSASDRSETEQLLGRLDRLASAALQHRVRLMVDAEQTYLQPAIDYCVAVVQARYNRTFPAVFNTYQCYLVDAGERVRADLARASAGGYYFAGKVVRGAYMVQERALAREQGRPDPIQPDAAATHAAYDAAVATIIRAGNQRREVMVASHNEQSVRNAVALMGEHGLPPSLASGVFFGQLLGMCDHITYGLARAGYPVFKYVPYGPVRLVVPYLIRRAQENSSVMIGAAKERELLWRELRRRAGLPSRG